MKCKICGTTENVKYEGMCRDCYTKSIGAKSEEEISTNIKKKSDYILIAQIILIVLGIILSLICFVSGYISTGVTIIIGFGATCFGLKICITIIDLLDDINKKLDK